MDIEINWFQKGRKLGTVLPTGRKIYSYHNTCILVEATSICTAKEIPLITVIIIAHNRRQFIKEAMKSAFDQQIPRERYEIIIVKNFHDEQIDDYIQKNQCVGIYTKEPSLGGKCAVAIAKARGEVISFLEDDDLFLEPKIWRVAEIFKDERVGYYHNECYVFRASNNILLFNNHRKSLNFKVKIDLRDLDVKKLRYLLKKKAYFNLSSISIRKRVIVDYLYKLKEMNIAVDNFMFYIALSSGLCIVADSMVLTAYRRHSLNISVSSSREISKFIEDSTFFLNSDILGYKIIRSLVNSVLLIQALDCRILAPRLNKYIIDRKSEHIRFSDFFDALKSSVQFRYKNLLLLVIMCLVTVPYASAGKKLYYIFSSRNFS